MHAQRKRHRPGQRITHYDELEARSTLSRLQHAVDDGDEAAAAASGWRQARAIAEDLDRAAAEGRG